MLREALSARARLLATFARSRSLLRCDSHRAAHAIMGNSNSRCSLGAAVQRKDSCKYRLRVLRQARAAFAMPVAGTTLPSAGTVEGYVRNLLGSLEADPERGWELLRRHLGSVTLTPTAEGGRRFYVAAGAFDLRAARYPEHEKAPVTGGLQVRGYCDCGGRI